MLVAEPKPSVLLWIVRGEHPSIAGRDQFPRVQGEKQASQLVYLHLHRRLMPLSEFRALRLGGNLRNTCNQF